MKSQIFKYFISLNLFLFPFIASTQVSIIIGENKVALNQAFEISISNENGLIDSYTAFPEIEGMVMKEGPNSKEEKFIDGKKVISQTITKYYYAFEEGTYLLYGGYVMEINGIAYTLDGTEITVNPKDESFGEVILEEEINFSSEDTREFIETQETAFLGLTTNQDEVFVGEGFNIILAFYVALSNEAELKFHELNPQLVEVLKKIKPDNCWEEDFDIREIQKRPVTINGEAYHQYKIYQASFYPFNDEPIIFPSVDLKMIKYNVLKGEGDVEDEKVPEYITFSTNAKTITVKELPEHPLRDQVIVGNFTLKEELPKLKFVTGEGFKYRFRLQGQGNISAIKAPEVKSSKELVFYEAGGSQLISHSESLVSGEKVFEYNLVAKEAGDYPLSEQIEWIYFNPSLEEYDTLRPQFVVEVSGESLKNLQISISNFGKYYEKIASENNSFVTNNHKVLFRRILNTLLISLLVSIVVLFFKYNRS